jgi:hypothetical protein
VTSEVHFGMSKIGGIFLKVSGVWNADTLILSKMDDFTTLNKKPASLGSRVAGDD